MVDGSVGVAAQAIEDFRDIQLIDVRSGLGLGQSLPAQFDCGLVGLGGRENPRAGSTTPTPRARGQNCPRAPTGGSRAGVTRRSSLE